MSLRRHRGVTPYDVECAIREAMHTLATPWKTKEGATYHAGAPGDDGGDFGDGLFDDANSDEAGFGAVGSDKSSRRSAMAASAALPAAISALPSPMYCEAGMEGTFLCSKKRQEASPASLSRAP